MQKYERETNTHVYFLRGVFSNFQKASFIYKGLSFENTEQAFMWEKARHFGDMESCSLILSSSTPMEAKGLGRGVKGYVDKEWDKVRYGYMLEVNRQKYLQNESFLKILLSTEDKILVECNGKDRVWSCGYYATDLRSLDETRWCGRNLLGKVLMELRSDFKGN